jgi:uncharacterized membrane protein
MAITLNPVELPADAEVDPTNRMHTFEDKATALKSHPGEWIAVYEGIDTRRKAVARAANIRLSKLAGTEGYNFQTAIYNNPNRPTTETEGDTQENWTVYAKCLSQKRPTE